jgi:hypothetical protein
MKVVPTISELTVQPFVAGDMRTVFPLMRQVDPSLDLKRWMLFARPLIGRRDGRAGILVARRAKNRFPCGAVCFHVTRDLQLGAVLTAEHFITLDLLYPQAVLTALSTALDEVAARLHCSAVRAIVRSSSAAIADDLSRAGLGHDGVTLLRPVETGLAAYVMKPPDGCDQG